MINNILKVYDEDLAKGALNQTSIGSDKVLEAGSTMGALCVNVFAVGNTSVSDEVVVTVKHGDTKDGSFAEIMTIPVQAGEFKDGNLMATATLPQDVKDFIAATVSSSTSNSGNVRVTLGYLAR